MSDFLRNILGQGLLNYYHLAVAILANIYYGFPSRKLHVIGVTGTDGKTTVVSMIASILRAAELPTVSLSTVNAQIGDRLFNTGLHTTTPSSFLLQKLLSQAAAAGAKYAVLEITSHALDQHRAWGIGIETAVLTNVSHEHLDYHKTLSSYMEAKAGLFKNAKNAVLNADDKSFEYFSRVISGAQTTYGMSSKAQIWASGIKENLESTEFTMNFSAESVQVRLNLSGKFNIANALAAAAVARNCGVTLEKIAAGLAALEAVPGRMEFLGGNRTALVDFAHTPHALENLLQFLRPQIRGRIILVFGSAGERDSTKRPMMGRAADRYADLIILTREDNRSEPAENICDDIVKGIKNKKRGENYFVILDRREAIKFAFSKRQAEDLVVVTGKGHEQSLNIDGEEVPWDDRKIVLEELKSGS